MRKITELTRKDEIFSFLNRNREINLYLIGDLDDFFFPHTKWYALEENNGVEAIALLYSGGTVPTLLSFVYNKPDLSFYLLQQIKPLLPSKFYAHLSGGLADAFGKDTVIESLGKDYRMILRSSPPQTVRHEIKKLLPGDDNSLKQFYDEAYPHNWYDSRMLETGWYRGVSENGKITGVAGVHVVSEEYSIAALGNIATHPSRRGQGIAADLTAYLCRELSKKVSTVGLNVKANNAAAIKCYSNIGFEITGEFEEYLFRSC
jgi:RimJ/RimL family protein N-acetyltransferase